MSWWPAPYPTPLTYPAFTAPGTDTIKQLLASEKTEGKKVAAEGSLWLLRAMNFACKALLNNSAQLSESFTKSSTPHPPTVSQLHHGRYLQGTHTFPATNSPHLLCNPLIHSFTLEKVEEQLEAWLDALGAILKRLVALTAGKHFNVNDDAFGKAAA
ncbi:hypothetical protein BOTBODRAFT_182107 [Botryobasidium botryosum FD-172 SS1]|uniref:Uncharacterized protein n=1 Tax=Botryobasidium botryosum (strain FD-172 SS1) TaxID=930990 RepID=A0A067LUJ7_BOTB1|nr:hypothetical protein BOTBODRAFT_182107 [Botryobasidium botryosum FD-172 SS1]